MKLLSSCDVPSMFRSRAVGRLPNINASPIPSAEFTYCPTPIYPQLSPGIKEDLYNLLIVFKFLARIETANLPVGDSSPIGPPIVFRP